MTIMRSETLQVVLASPRGFCAGVRRAIETVERALALGAGPVYVRHEIVHNKQVVERLSARGAIFVDELFEIPDGALAIFSAHGVPQAVEREAARRGLDVIDATCPLVHKVHKQAQRYAQRGYDIVVVGHAEHIEVIGTVGQIPGAVSVVGSVADVAGVVVRDPARVAYVTQTTLSVGDTRHIIAALRQRFPAIVGPDTRDICYATHNRQQAVVELARRAECILVIGSGNSSNSNRLREIGEAAGIASYLVERPAAIDPAWLDDVSVVGVTAGASVPEDLVEEAIACLGAIRPIAIESLTGVVEDVVFRLPARIGGPDAPALA
jgi:4-hydroxy-3-methylbut-2-enyl diphosphate reductase